MHVVMLNKSRNCGLWSENALDSKTTKNINDHRDEFEGKWSMFIYIYQKLQTWQKQAHEPHSCGHDGIKEQ